MEIARNYVTTTRTFRAKAKREFTRSLQCVALYFTHRLCLAVFAARVSQMDNCLLLFPPLARFRLVCRCHDRLRRILRKQLGRDENPSAAIIDSQSVKTSEEGAGERGFDAGKKINGRKRHILVDTLGLLLAVKVHKASIQDRDGAKLLFETCRDRLPRLFLIWADGGYRGKLIAWVAINCLWLLEIVKRNDAAIGFQVLPRRWVVERTFAWLSKQRRLSKDYERECQTSESWIYLAMVSVMLKSAKLQN